MIEIGKEKASVSKVKNVDFVQIDIYDIRYKKESFDVILAFNMLHIISNPQNILQRISELLKPEGLFISLTPCPGGKLSFLLTIQILLVRILWKIRIIPIPIRRLKSVELDDLLANGNFHSIDT